MSSVHLSRRSALKALGAGAAALAIGGGPAVGAARAAGGTTAGDLRAALGSKVLFPGDPDYDAERAAFNTLITQSPNAIVLAQTAQDVATAVRIGAGGLGWPIAVQATGHGICVPADGALLINMRELNGVTVNSAARTARISGGAKWKDVLAVSAPLGLLPPVGSTSDVGATGYIGGGGVPVIGRTYGFASDRVRSIELVAPDGRQLCLSPYQHADLFWAVRGGGSNFGAVTSFEIDLLPATTVYAGGLVFPAATAAQAYQQYVAWTATASDRITSVASFVHRPTVEALSIEVVYLGSAADGAAEIAPLRALGPATDSVAEVPIALMDSIFNVPATPSASVASGALIGALDPSGIDLVFGTLGFQDSTVPSGVLEVRQLGGAFGRQPAAPSAVGNRDADFLLFLNNPVPTPAQAAAIEQWQQDALARLAPVLTGKTVPTFLGTLDTTAQEVSTAYTATDWSRLRQLKQAYDPANLFRINHNIR
ncbi:FAD-binding oxidoreductase [Phaeacidiphilus oryzae]|uniref:FAD-binding oxidoreductase n=1 Tax=Phaeacidiphilus oryzae TaxID=348818 RepID=UPI00068E4F82|nr:FAD-binding oxidoreductase [Phaeacidiphilus oryzae]